MSKVRKNFDIFYFNAVNNEKPNTVEVDIEFEDQCPFCQKDDALMPVTGATPVNDYATYYHFYDSYANTICRFCSVNVLHYIAFHKAGLDLHFKEEKVYSPQSPKNALLEALKTRYPTTMEIYKQAEVAEKKNLYYIEGIAYFNAFQDLIDNYLTIKNSNQNNLDITDYTKLDIEEKINKIESRKGTKIISSEDRVKLIDISNQIQNRIYDITEDQLIFIKNIITIFLVEVVKEAF